MVDLVGRGCRVGITLLSCVVETTRLFLSCTRRWRTEYLLSLEFTSHTTQLCDPHESSFWTDETEQT